MSKLTQQPLGSLIVSPTRFFTDEASTLIWNLLQKLNSGGFSSSRALPVSSACVMTPEGTLRISLKTRGDSAHLRVCMCARVWFHSGVKWLWWHTALSCHALTHTCRRSFTGMGAGYSTFGLCCRLTWISDNNCSHWLIRNINSSTQQFTVDCMTQWQYSTMTL